MEVKIKVAILTNSWEQPKAKELCSITTGKLICSQAVNNDDSIHVNNNISSDININNNNIIYINLISYKMRK